MKEKVRVIVEIVIFIAVLGGITFFYYFGNNKEDISQDTSDVGIIDVNDSNFESVVLKSDIPVILEFSSNMCPPCLTMVPTLIDIAKNNKDVKVVTLNTSDKAAEKTAEKYKVEATPTIVIIKDGEIVKTFLGATNKETIMKGLEEVK